MPHYDGGEILQFITLHLGGAMPQSVLRKWQIELEQSGFVRVEYDWPFGSAYNGSADGSSART